MTVIIWRLAFILITCEKHIFCGFKDWFDGNLFIEIFSCLDEVLMIVRIEPGPCET